MSNLAVTAGLDPSRVADLDEDEFVALQRAVTEHEKARMWTNTNEALAAAVEALWAILARLQAGVPVVQVQKAKKPKDYGTYPRPAWLKRAEPKELVVTNVAEAVRFMRGG